MSEKRCNVFVRVILFILLINEPCYGKYDCYQLPSVGKDICFLFDASPKNFKESKDFCKATGGFLLEIYNENVQQLVKQLGTTKPFHGEAWLNLVKKRNSEDWVWDDGNSG